MNTKVYNMLNTLMKALFILLVLIQIHNSVHAKTYFSGYGYAFDVPECHEIDSIDENLYRFHDSLNFSSIYLAFKPYKMQSEAFSAVLHGNFHHLGKIKPVTSFIRTRDNRYFSYHYGRFYSEKGYFMVQTFFHEEIGCIFLIYHTDSIQNNNMLAEFFEIGNSITFLPQSIPDFTNLLHGKVISLTNIKTDGSPDNVKNWISLRGDLKKHTDIHFNSTGWYERIDRKFASGEGKKPNSFRAKSKISQGKYELREIGENLILLMHNSNGKTDIYTVNSINTNRIMLNNQAWYMDNSNAYFPF